MKNFINFTDKNEVTKWVNLRNVSSINVLSDKIVLNMNFSFTDSKQGLMSFAYFINPIQFSEITKTKRFEKDFVKIGGEDRLVYVNKTQVSHITLEPGKNLKRDKIIICFSNSVSKKNENRIVPEYMYVSLEPNTNSEKVFEKFLLELDKE